LTGSIGESSCAQCLISIEGPLAASGAPLVVSADPTVADKADRSQPDLDDETEADVCATLIDAARSNDLPPAFLARLIWQESRFDPWSMSPVGAQGIAQFMPTTASEIGLEDPYDPIQALPASARLLKSLHREFGNLGLAAAAYNAGSRRIRNWLSNRQSLPRETSRYVHNITGHSAETWIDEQSVVMLPTVLPAGTPCNEIATDAPASVRVRVSLTPAVADLLRRAKAEMLAAASRARKKVAKAQDAHLRKSGIASRHGRNLLAARNSQKAQG
jgi:hypothetical protein